MKKTFEKPEIVIVATLDDVILSSTQTNVYGDDNSTDDLWGGN